MSSSSSMSPSYVPSQRLSFLVNYGSSLGAVLRRRKMRMKNAKKNRAIKIDPNVNNTAVEDIKRLKEELKTAKQSLVPPSYSLDERGGKRVIEKVECILNELIAVDREHEQSYKELLDEIGELKDDRGRTLDSQKPQSSGSTGDEGSLASQVLPFDNVDSDSKAFNKVSGSKDLWLLCKFLSGCDDLVIPQNVEVSKGVLINLLIGLRDLEPLGAEQTLADLVAEPSLNLMTRAHAYSSRIIISKHLIKSISSRTVWDYDIKIIKVTGGEVVPKLDWQTLQGSLLFMINSKLDRWSSSTQTRQARTYKLNEKVFNIIDELGSIRKIRRMTDGVRCVHLGNFNRDMGHVVVDDTFLSAFDKFMKVDTGIEFLSLHGISRIRELPESVCKLHQLRVLDLRSCQDLKSLPNDIGNIKNLICLDLSECYQLDHIPKGITNLTYLELLLGFIIITDENLQQLKYSKLQVAEFADLKHLQYLKKLTIRTRRMSFPTKQDLLTLNEMLDLRKFKVKWVKSLTPDDARSEENLFYTEGLPGTLQKLELQAAPDSKASQLLGLISYKKSCHRNLEKIYIRGGTLQTKLCPNLYFFPHVKILRLRYLPLLLMTWHDFQLSFPNLSFLQIVECPNLIFFPCDQNGVWIQSESSFHIISR